MPYVVFRPSAFAVCGVQASKSFTLETPTASIVPVSEMLPSDTSRLAAITSAEPCHAPGVVFSTLYNQEPIEALASHVNKVHTDW